MQTFEFGLQTLALPASLAQQVWTNFRNLEGTMLPSLRYLCQRTRHIPITSVGLVRRYLSWENEQRCKGLLEKSSLRYRKETVGAAVLVSLCSVAGDPAILYTLRSSTLTGLYKGQVSFPGGKCDDSDQDAISTALRETHEELGIQLKEDCVWGIMRHVPDRTNMMVAPVLANLGPLEDLALKPNPQEVEAVFTLSLSHLLQEKNQGYTHYCRDGVYHYTMPVFLHGPHRVWGLTAVITDLTLEMLAPGKYHRRTYVKGQH